jgi:hypothetical protein
VFSRATVRLFALLMLMFSGVETLVCDILTDSPKQTANATAGDQTSDDDCGCLDGCLCCCTHAIPAATLTLANLALLRIVSLDLPQLRLDPIQVSVYHPPRT